MKTEKHFQTFLIQIINKHLYYINNTKMSLAHWKLPWTTKPVIMGIWKLDK